MASPTIKDQVQQGKDRLVTQWNDKAVVQGLLESYLENVQVVEDLHQQLLDERSVFTAIGVQLDNIGTIVGEPRKGRLDEPYREAILNRIAINASDSTPEKIMEIMITVSGATTANLTDHSPASFHLFINAFVNNSTALTLDTIAGAGISTRLMFDEGIVASFIAGEAVYINPFLILDDDGHVVLTTATVIDGDLLYSELTEVIFEDSFLPDTIDIGLLNPLCEVIDDTQYDILTGFVTDENGDFVLNENGDLIRWTEVEVRP